MQYLFVALLLATAVITNVPLGIWRNGLRRFSPSWFLAIHASIPLLIVLRLSLVPSNWVVPPEIGLAVVAQIAGGRLARRWSDGSDSAITDNDVSCDS